MTTYKKYNEVDRPLFSRSGADLSPALYELHHLLEEVFGEDPPVAEMREVFVFPALTHLEDPSGQVSTMFAKGTIDPGYDISKQLYYGLICDARPDQPIIIIGHVGVGKSTLVHHTFDSLDNVNNLPIFVDFKKANSDTSEIIKFVVKEIDAALQKEIDSQDQSVLDDIFFYRFPDRRNQLANLAKYDSDAAEAAKVSAQLRLQDEPGDWNQARIRYIQEKLNRKVFLIFDNVDHHITPAFIQKTLTLGMNQGSVNGCGVILTIRDYNFGIAYERAAYAAKSFTLVRVEGATLHAVIERRIKRTIERYEDRRFSHIVLPNAHMPADVYLRILAERLHSLLNRQVLDILEGLSGPNLRRAFNCLRHIFSVKTLSQPEDLARSKLSKYDVLECLLRPGLRHYVSPEKDIQSLITNLFDDASPREVGNNLIRIRVSQCLEYYGDSALHKRVIADLKHLGYEQARVNRVLQLFRDQGLMESGDHSEPMSSVDGPGVSHQLTTIGHFYIKSLLYEYRYILAVKEATWFPTDWYERIFVSGPASSRLDLRETEVLAFTDYIAKLEGEEELRCTDHSLLKQVFPRIAGRLRKECHIAIHSLRSGVRERRHDQEQD